MEITSTGLITWTPQKNQIGEHTVTVKVSDGTDEVSTQFIVTVDKDKKEPTTDALGGMLPILLVVIIIVVVVVVVLVMSRKGKTPEEPLEEDTEEYPGREEEPPEPKEEPEETPDEPEEDDAELEDEIDLDDLEDED